VEDRKKKRVWTKCSYWNAKNRHMNVLKELEYNEPQDLHNYLCADKEVSDTLFKITGPKIKKSSTHMR
jgi:hypothetical protein